MDNILQLWQGELLTNCLTPCLDRLHPQGDYFVASDVGIYWRQTQPELDGVIAPDWYYIPNVPRLRNGVPRRSYVHFVEWISPLIVIEVVSRDGWEEHDTTPETGKFWIYETVLKSPYLVIHSFRTDELEIYEFIRARYRRREPNSQGRILIPEMEVELGLWEGAHRGYTARWLRAWDREGRLLATAEEREVLERQAKELAQNQAERERQKSAKLAEKLRQLGIDPEGIE